ncbi:MAG: exodeoxyribonuclease VII small subunit [Acidimicrobiaceae bacterium]|nr:exodeoxyribonuclease VII small subunit [Acidimicrobiaceae bacterium]MCY4280266.1 exodeoxyribonuclease VII small subunit [Acidimicrobiaceae bacterium]MCY4293553.1 exodeoxyribonuclease VII small subunit [Acidimicrobiaceae bacterium]
MNKPDTETGEPDAGSGDTGSGSGDTAGTGSAEPGYAEAMAELEEILEELESEDPDVDLLASRVERAANLIQICRRRITRAGVQVERVVAVLDAPAK